MEYILLSLAAWFILGAIAALWIYYDMKKRAAMFWHWILVGFLLSALGLVLYLVIGREKKTFIYPPAPDYGKPDYKFEGDKEQPQAAPNPAVESKLHKPEKKVVEQIEGIPRCSGCGAAISKHDMKCPGCGRILYPQ